MKKFTLHGYVPLYWLYKLVSYLDEGGGYNSIGTQWLK